MISFAFETITPELATRLLEEHDDAVLKGEIINRRRKAAAVRRIAADILSDQWFPQTGETIKFEKNGDKLIHGRHLVDGQTRLAACQQAKRPIEVWVAKGVERNAFVYIDSGDKRTLKDVLQIAGESSAAILSPALSWMSRWDADKDMLEPGNAAVTHAQAKKILEADPAIRKSAQRVQGVTLIGKGLAAFLHRIFSRKDADLADRFIDAIATGQNLVGGDPFYVLREALIKNKASRRKSPQADLIKISIKAWNATREGRSVKQLKVKSDEKVVLA